MAKFMIVMCICGIFATIYCYCFVGHSLGALMYLKTNTRDIFHLRSVLQIFCILCILVQVAIYRRLIEMTISTN